MGDESDTHRLLNIVSIHVHRPKGASMPITTRLLSAGVAGAVLAGLVTAPVGAAPGPAGADRTSPTEAARVDRVPTPKLDWYDCYGQAQCATVQLPLDYDRPTGPTVELAVLRVRARDQKHRIGSLFVNPGGPGGSGASLALAAPRFLSDEVLGKFDVVGFDPRGVGVSQQVKCFPSHKDQTKALAGMNVAFPWTKKEEKAYVASSEAVGKACSATGKPLTGAMSTGEVARDMDVLRRAVGDTKLTYLGFSYGTALGQYYANMFPDRVRAVAVDGVLDPTAWVGDRKHPTEQDQRLRSADGAYKALHEILVRCDKAGGQKCAFAKGDPVANFELVAERLRAKPLVITDEDGEFTFGYADFVGNALGMLYDPSGSEGIVQMTEELLTLTEPPATGGAAGRATAGRNLRALLAKVREQRKFDFPYDNSLEAFLGVDCTDGVHATTASDWPKLAAAADKRAPYFGRAWTWGTAPCAGKTWTVRDEDAYTGPFNRKTSAPVLIVGNYWDPATNYDGAVSSSKLLPNSRLLSSDSWGHTAYGTSACVTGAVDAYLLAGTLPAKGKVCVGDVQPFADAPADARTTRAPADPAAVARQGAPAPGTPKQLPPVAPLLPGAMR
jgi:pimeloyl-ACP methyl ester carboxylesterase